MVPDGAGSCSITAGRGPWAIIRPVSTNSLSQRARRLLADSPFAEYLLEHIARTGSLYDAATNPDGYIPMSVAENLLLGDLLIERMATVRDVPARILGYDAMVGSLAFREQLSRFLGRTVFGREFSPEQLAVLAGAGSVLEILFHNLCDPGDGVLVPTPGYASFWPDLETRDELVIVPVHTTISDRFRLTPEALDRAVAEAGRQVKVLLFTSPNNPLGFVYTAEEIAEVLDWAEAAGVHVVFDEIYALSVFGDRPFTSCAQLRRRLGDWVHIIWAFSKDFGASGLRCGLLVSENEQLLKAVDILSNWASVSGHTQYLLGEVVSDEIWVDSYLARARGALGDAYQRVTVALEDQAIPYIPAGAGFFLVCDLRQYLREPTWEAERDLWWRLLEEGNVNLTPGEACHSAEPGFFRLCFASMPTDAVVTGVRRMGGILSRPRI